MDDLIGDFVAECRDMLEALGGEIVAWEADPGDRARLDSIFRFVHTVKGNCGFFEFPRLEALSHAAEDALADVRAGRRQADPALVSGVLAVIDRINEMVQAIENGSDFEEGGDSALIEALATSPEGGEASEGVERAIPSPPISGERQAKAANTQRTIRLPVDLLDRLMSGVSDMVLARNDLARRLRETTNDIAVDGPFERLSSIIADMRDAITRTRMQRLDNLFGALPRLIRDLSNELGKQVMVDIEGGDVELDREMIEMIRDPLTHIIRNAVDHGIETPPERLAAGKREIGLLTVSARQSGNQISIDIADDGKGIDGERLVEKAVAAGIVSPADGARLGQQARYALIFEPGLSTAQAVTSISGRGVGMDVVRANVERIGGVIEVDSTRGQGTRMTLRVPLTLTIIPALTVSIGSQRFGIPRSAIEEIVHTGGDSLEFNQVGGGVLAKIRDRRVPCIGLSQVLGLGGSIAPGQQTLVVLRLAGGDMFAVAVDRVHDHEELVIKPAAPPVMATGTYAGTTLADDGSPTLLLDIAGLAKVGGITFEARERARIAEASVTPARTVPVLLFIGLDGARRAIRMGLIDRIEEVEANAVQATAGCLRVQIDDRIIPLAGRGAEGTGSGKVQLFRLNDGQSEIGYAVREVLEMASIDDPFIPAADAGEIEGVTLINGEPAEIVDTHWVFAQHSGDEFMPMPTRPVCRIPRGDPWFQNLLRPLVETAGYRVVDEHDEQLADVAILPCERDLPAPQANRVIWLRSSVEQASHVSDSIYRYDRAGLITALKAVGGRP